MHWLYSQKGREYNDAYKSLQVPDNQELVYISVYSVYKKVQQISCKCQQDTYGATENVLLLVLIMRVSINT